jgi:hypothetical protein
MQMKKLFHRATGAEVEKTAKSTLTFFRHLVGIPGDSLPYFPVTASVFPCDRPRISRQQPSLFPGNSPLISKQQPPLFPGNSLRISL